MRCDSRGTIKVAANLRLKSAPKLVAERQYCLRGRTNVLQVLRVLTYCTKQRVGLHPDQGARA
jgi:hypothetical protein